MDTSNFNIKLACVEVSVQPLHDEQHGDAGPPPVEGGLGGDSPCSSTSLRERLSRDRRASRGAWSFLTRSHRSSVRSRRPGDLQLCQPVGRVLTFLMDLQVFPGHGIPAATVSCQLVNKLVLAGQRQAEPSLSPVGETQLPPLADRALDSFTSLSGLRAQGQQPLPRRQLSS
ncbi:hypothetical protein F7725_017074 [Dissostichus mawsoni]|uniref:Uncharacterized protein n=1 Tax=Dissostichus mawsoni TaxID=36200 RepID=A0A7J5Z5H2_DISMA|nr:hypothetical protein F7725_017074 [Dissostichus mawsoni]